MQIHAKNIDEWLDDYLLGKLSEAAEQSAELVLFEHPELGARLDFRQEVIRQAQSNGESIFAAEIKQEQQHKAQANSASDSHSNSRAKTIPWWEQLLLGLRRPAVIGGLATAAVLVIVSIQLIRPSGEVAMDHGMAMQQSESPAQTDQSERSLRRKMMAERLGSLPAEEALAADSNTTNLTAAGQQNISTNSAQNSIADAIDDNTTQPSADENGIQAISDDSGASTPEAIEDQVDYDVIETLAMADTEVDFSSDMEYADSDSDALMQAPPQESNNPAKPNSPEASRQVDSSIQRMENSAAQDNNSTTEFAEFNRLKVQSDTAIPQRTELAQFRFDPNDSSYIVDGATSLPQSRALNRGGEFGNNEMRALKTVSPFPVYDSERDTLIVPEFTSPFASQRMADNVIGRLSNPANGDSVSSSSNLTFEWTERQPDNSYLIIVEANRNEVARFKIGSDLRTFTPQNLDLSPGHYEWFLAADKYYSLRANFYVRD